MHVKGTLYTDQAVFPYLKAAGGGTIVNFGSAAAIRGAQTYAVYGAAKGAVFAWTRNLAIEWGPHNIRVNAIAPFMKAACKGSRGRARPSRGECRMKGQRRSPRSAGTLGVAELDLAPMVCLLLGDGGTYITGQVIAVDGGFAMLGS